MWFGSESSGDSHSLLDFVDVVFCRILATFFEVELPVFWGFASFKDEFRNVYY